MSGGFGPAWPEAGKGSIPKRILVISLPSLLPVTLLLSERWEMPVLPVDKGHCLFLYLTGIQASKLLQEEEEEVK